MTQPMKSPNSSVHTATHHAGVTLQMIISVIASGQSPNSQNTFSWVELDRHAITSLIVKSKTKGL